jgi:hypothetical protein
LPVAIDTDVESYIAGRRAALDREIEEVAPYNVLWSMLCLCRSYIIAVASDE